MTLTRPPKVLISYTHDSEPHKQQVLDFSNRLIIEEGIESWIDRYVEDATPSEGWPAWMNNKVKNSDYVLIVCTHTYWCRFHGEDVPNKGKGLGGRFESFLVQNQLYQDSTINTKFIPVIFQQEDSQHRPVVLQPYTYYCLTDATSYEQLIRRLTNQPAIVRPQIGKMRQFTSPYAASPDRVVNPISTESTEPISDLHSIEVSQPQLTEFYQTMPSNLKLMQAFFGLAYSARVALARRLGLLEEGEPEPNINRDRFSAQLLLRADQRALLGALWEHLFNEAIDPNPYRLQ